MPSIFTLSGLDASAKPKKAKRTKASSSTPHVGYCKDVYNSRTKKTIALCYVGKGKGKGQTRSGWIFKSKKG